MGQGTCCLSLPEYPPSPYEGRGWIQGLLFSCIELVPPCSLLQFISSLYNRLSLEQEFFKKNIYSMLANVIFTRYVLMIGLSPIGL
jgi:hypothetical protein